MILIKEIQFIKVCDNKYLMLNLINGAADYINNDVFSNLSDNCFEKLDENIIKAMKKRKYLFDNKKEYKQFIDNLDIRIEELEKNSIPNFLIVPSYACNLSCTYCYEKTYEIKHSNIKDKKEIIDKQFKVIDKIVKDIRNENTEFSNEEVKITIMGGEPLLIRQKKVITYIIKKIESRGYRANIITNGVEIIPFISLLKNEVIDHIQITLDGTKDIHDKRRIFPDGRGSFNQIIKNVKEILNNEIKTYLRINVDKENIGDLPKLANLIINNFPNREKLYPYIYLLQDGGCAGQQNVVKESIAIKNIFDMEKEFPNMSIFRKKFHPEVFIDSIFNNKPYQPVLRHCGASRNQFILDYKGNIYKCWHGIGNGNYKTGKFDKDFEFNKQNKIWQDRSVNNLKECRDCKYRYICGTGCPAAMHLGKSHLDIKKPMCVDYKTLINTLVLEYINKS